MLITEFISSLASPSDNQFHGGDDWELIGTGSYTAASVGPGYIGETGSFVLFSEPDKAYAYVEHGPAAGFDAGAGGGLLLIFGPPDINTQDLSGYAVSVAGGAGVFEGAAQTSATRNGLPTWNYLILNVGLSLSIPGGTVSSVHTTIIEYDESIYKYPCTNFMPGY